MPTGSRAITRWAARAWPDEGERREKKDGVVEEVVEDLTADPDAPEQGHVVPPPQTIANEPECGKR